MIYSSGAWLCTRCLPHPHPGVFNPAPLPPKRTGSRADRTLRTPPLGEGWPPPHRWHFISLKLWAWPLLTPAVATTCTQGQQSPSPPCPANHTAVPPMAPGHTRQRPYLTSAAIILTAAPPRPVTSPLKEDRRRCHVLGTPGAHVRPLPVIS